MKIAILLLLLTVPGIKNYSQNKPLIEISERYLSDFIMTQNAKTELYNENAILVNMEAKAPLVELIAPDKSWDLSNNTSISFHVSNLGNTSVALNCHLDNHQGCLGLLLLKPGESGIMRVLLKGNILPENHPFSILYEGMKGLPGGYLPHWAHFDASDVKKVRLSQINPSEEAVIIIRNIVAEGNINEKSLEQLKLTAFPFVDKYGQYIHKNWPGKINSTDELKGRIEKEDEDHRAFPSPANRSKYGGWENGGKHQSTGHFRTEKIDGKWWLIDPEGYLFWSHGITGVGKRAANTRISGREHYFKDLPSGDSPLHQFATTTPEEEILLFNFSESNLFLKYGKDWEKIYQEKAHIRLKSWGMNTMGNWSDTDTYMLRKTPYTVSVGFNWKKVGGELKFPDPYDPGYKPGLELAFLNHRETWNDPYCIGYFVDNELNGWGTIGQHVLQSPATDSSKVQLMMFLKQKYKEIATLNSTWGSDFESWQLLLNSTQEQKGEAVYADLLDFEKIMIDLYYKTCQEVIKKYAPNKLYLGSRLHNNHPHAVEIAAKHCDVISFNRYQFSPHNVHPPERSIDKPIIIGEFHFGALDRGMLHTGLLSVQNQEQRGRAYIQYIRAALENPYLVGAHWFQYGEQAVTGRSDGENYQIGFLDVFDNPYQETIDGCREIGFQLYKVRNESSNRIP